MKIDALLDVNVVAHEATDEVAVLLDLEAPPAPVAHAPRPPGALQVVLDRSGSMAGPPLEGAKLALEALVHRLEPTDRFGLVTFDQQAQVVIPAGPLTDKHAAIEAIRAIKYGGTTDLGSGYLRGLRELKRVVTDTGATVLVVSDGHVNQGLTDVDQFAAIAQKARTDGVVTSTLGYGRAYDETVLAAIARSGSGNHVFADDPDAAGAAIAAEVDGLLDKVVQAATLTVRFEPAVRMLRLYNDLPAHQVADGTVMIELGDLYAGEPRKLLLKLQVPAMAALGLAQVATLELQYVELPALVEHTVQVPITVNVVPGDQAAKRVADPTVRSEVLFQEAQDAKKRASEAFGSGDLETGLQLLGETEDWLTESLQVAPEAVARAIRGEQEEVRRMKGMGRDAGPAYLSKSLHDSYHRANRKRGRRTDPRSADDESGE